MSKFLRGLAPSALLLALLAGCAIAPAPLPPGALPEVPAQYRASPPTGAAAVPGWQAFGDAQLDLLLQRARERNTDIAIAAARVAQARALARQADAQRWPQLQLAGSAARQSTLATARSAQSSFGLGAELAYEADLFGRAAATHDAALLDARAQQSLAEGTRLLVESEVARQYYRLRALDAEQALLRDTVAADGQTLRLTESRWRAGEVTELEVARVRSEQAANEAEALALARVRVQAEHALALLVGEAAQNLEVAPGEWREAPPAVPAGLPSEMLQRRPDIAAAGHGLAAAQARLGVAQAAWLPQLLLTANGGVASTDLSDLLRGSMRAWGIGALLSLPVFDGGRRDAARAAAAAELDAGVAGYRGQVLVALKEVEDELAALSLLSQQAQAQTRAVTAAERATSLSGTRYRNGLVSQLELLDAQRSELRNRRAALQVRSAQFQSTIGLIRALGGGWAS